MSKENRKRVRLEAKIHVIFGDLDEEIHVLTGNISKSGVFLQTPFVFGEIGETVLLKISPPEQDQWFRLKGKISRICSANKLTEPQGIAVSFDRIEARYSTTFDRLFKALFDSRGLGCRKTARAEARISIDLKSPTLAQRLYSENISKGGVFLEGPSDGHELGQLVELSLWHPSGRRSMSVEGEIVHLRKAHGGELNPHTEGLGIRFIGLSRRKKEDLHLFLKSVITYKKKARRSAQAD